MIAGASMIVTGLTLASMLVAIAPAGAASLIKPEALSAGDLIRGESFSAVYYYGLDGFRYVFPNDKAYFTWYSNFDSVKWLSDSDMSSIQIGGNVTYKPGKKMIKINSDPKVYVVSKGGLIRAIASEAVASALYGSDWNKKIDDVPDGFFPNYTIGSTLDIASTYSLNAEMTDAANIGATKGLKAATIVTITNAGFSPSTVTISAGTVVRFENKDQINHAASADDTKWGTGTLASGKHFSRYFKQAGTYTYHDKYGTSVGTIVVQ